MINKFVSYLLSVFYCWKSFETIALNIFNPLAWCEIISRQGTGVPCQCELIKINNCCRADVRIITVHEICFRNYIVRNWTVKYKLTRQIRTLNITDESKRRHCSESVVTREGAGCS